MEYLQLYYNDLACTNVNAYKTSGSSHMLNIFCLHLYKFNGMKNQINKIMETEGLTPARFADEIGVQRSSISHIISGRNKPSYDFIVKILNRFSGINADWLLTGKGNMIKSSEMINLQGNSRQTSLFDQTSNATANKMIIDEKKIVQEDLNKTEAANRHELLKDGNISQKSMNIKQFTDVNNTKYILVFYEDGTFEKFNAR
jgi:transcriptional regulator with XRE-family HTH domain